MYVSWTKEKHAVPIVHLRGERKGGSEGGRDGALLPFK